MSFKTLSLLDLEFSLPSLDEQSFREVLRFADYIGYDTKARRSLYRLNLKKCAALNQEETRRLTRYGIFFSKELEDVLSELRAKRVVNIALQGGDLVVTATPEAQRILPSYLRYEPKTHSYRAKPKDLWSILKELEGKCSVNVSFDTRLTLTFQPKPLFELREYQRKCYEEWKKNGFKGVITLPTAAGKTFLALQAIAELKVRTLVVVPSIELLHQWRRKLASLLEAPKESVGVFGGGSKEVKELTVITYDSAYLNAEELSGSFMLIVADEAHHSVAEEFRRVFELSIAKYRMGLTATPLRSDGLHKNYDELIGPIIQPVSELELQKNGYIAGYKVKRIYVKLSPDAAEEYKRNLRIYRDYCERALPNIKDPRRLFELCLSYAAKDPKAREALRARSRARAIALNAKKKLELVEELLSRYGDKKVLIFSRYVEIVREISKKYLIPLIVAETSNEERRAILEMFKKGEVTKLASGMTLEEGIDVPDAQVGIIVSGSGSNREYVQRVGRLLRAKKEDALIVELVTKGTLDQQLSLRRRKFIAWPSEGS